ncbi:protein EVI2A [Dipodomys merriami]|uniref:protein EVI2A n=1 Tax=Dipodomys merriami TaxID=94247 RepID=UPI0038560503
MDMEHIGQYLHLAFLITIIFPLSTGTKANHTQLWASKPTAWDSAIQSSPDTHQNGNINSNPDFPQVDYKNNSTNMPEIATSSHMASLPSKSQQELYTSSVVNNSFLITESSENTSKSHDEVFKENVCAENNMAMLICLIIIAVLFLICTFLFLSTVVLANKVSSLRRSKQVGKRQPRSNGDFLASSGLWPAESDTWKRAKQLTGPNLMMQSPGVRTATRERTGEEGTEKLTN